MLILTEPLLSIDGETLAKNTFHHKNEAEIDLVVWYDASEDEVKHMYVPYPGVSFLTDKPFQFLTVRLVSPQSQAGRFEIRSHSIRHTKARKEVFYEQSGQFMSTTDLEKFPPRTEAIRVKLSLKAKDATYLVIHVFDSIKKIIIDCDPQIENGSKT
jgi:hypothetical protein